MSLRHLLFIVIWFSAVAMYAQPQQAFEGVITYVVKTKVKQKDNPYNKYYTQKYGDTLTIYYHKNGSERKEYNNTGSLGLEWEIYNKINNETYSKWNDVDSVFYTSSADTSSALLPLVPDSTVTILGKTCTSFKALSIDLNSNKPKVQTLYYSGEEYITPAAYEKRKKGHFDKFYTKSESLFLRMDLDTKYVVVTFEAISIEKMNPDPNLFIIPNNLAKIKS